jgi:hopanoid-associated phosphorylase
MIIVVGLAFEARIAAKSGFPVICAGNGRNLTAALAGAITQGCNGLISFGIAGGLKPDLPPGTCIVGCDIVAGDRSFSTDRKWSQNLLQRLPRALSGALAGVTTPVTTADAKRALHAATGALAVDMESHTVAAAAAQYGLPMAAVRVICDPAARDLPEMAFRSVRADGTTNIATLLQAIVRQPNHIPAMLRLALDARAARTTLARCGRLLGPGLGLAEVIQAARPQ